MTSNLKCPFCNSELVGTIGHPICRNQDCVMCDDPMPQDLLEELICTRKALEIARKALKETQHWLGVVRCSAVSHLNNQNNTLLEHYETDPTVQNIDKAKRILKHYIEQIEHKVKDNDFCKSRQRNNQ